MRKESFSVGNYIHIFNRGNRKQPIVYDNNDRNHFLQSLFYFNTKIKPLNAISSLSRLNLDKLEWPYSWPTREPIVRVIAFVLMENHFHLLVKEIINGGVSLFMQRLGTAMSMRQNIRYQESGALFQGSYKARCVKEDLYLKYLSVYIQVKNTFELYPAGLRKAVKEFDEAYDWAIDYPYCSLGDFTHRRNRKIIDKDIFSELFSNSKEYKEFARDCILGINLEDKLGELILET